MRKKRSCFLTPLAISQQEYASVTENQVVNGRAAVRQDSEAKLWNRP